MTQAQLDALTAPSGTMIGQSGRVVVTPSMAQSPIRVNFAGPIENAVIVLTGTFADWRDTYTLRVVERDATGFSFIVDEWEYQDGIRRSTETVNWVAVAAGVHTLSDGRVIEAGTVLADSQSGAVTFSANFGLNAPVVVTSVMSRLDMTAVDSDPLNVTQTGFDARLQVEDARASQPRSKELVGYIAFGVGGNVQRVENVKNPAYQVNFAGLSDAVIVADTQTRREADAEVLGIVSQNNDFARIYVAEEQSLTLSTLRVIGETVGVVALNSGTITGTRTGNAAWVTQAQLDAATQAVTGVEIGRAGTVTVSTSNIGKPIRVNFGASIDTPIIVLTGSVSSFAPPYTLRIVDRDATGFTFMVQEWEYQTTLRFQAVTVNWVAVAAGVHTLSDGRVIEAGTVLANQTTGAVQFAANFTTAPVVVTSVMSALGNTPVDSDPLNVTRTSFDARLQQEEALAGRARAQEVVGYIAFSTGGSVQLRSGVNHNETTIGLGANFTQSVVIADTQTRAEADTQTVMIRSQSGSSVSLVVAEEQSLDFETFRSLSETVGVAAFEAGALRGTRTGNASLVTAAQLAAAQQAAEALNYQPIGEAGSITRSISSSNVNTPIRVNYTAPIQDAVVMLTGSDVNGTRYTLRVVSSDANGFSFVVENWSNQFGFSLSNVNIQWTAIRAGVHQLADGRLIEAGTVSATATTGKVTFDADFTAPPVVLTTTMSRNNTTPVDSDPINITRDGFSARLQTAQLYGGLTRPAETVGYIAMSTGGSATTGFATSMDVYTGSTTWRPPSGFTDMIVLADTQTQNSADLVDVKWRTSSTSTTFTLQTSMTSFVTSERLGIMAFSRGVLLGRTLS